MDGMASTRLVRAGKRYRYSFPPVNRGDFPGLSPDLIRKVPIRLRYRYRGSRLVVARREGRNPLATLLELWYNRCA